MSEQLRENSNLTALNKQLMSEKEDLQGQTRELTREKNGLNWTLGVILEYKDFPVDILCPQKGENMPDTSRGQSQLPSVQ